MIESTTNPKVKYVRRLQADRRFRLREGVFVAEGVRWLGDLLGAAVRPTAIYHTAAWDTAVLPDEWERTAVSAAVMAQMSDVETPPGVLAVVPMPVSALPSRLSWVLILDRIQNPGNLGTMIRTAAAAGVDAVLLAPGCVDVWNPKVVRGTMGTLLRLPIVVQTWDEIAETVAGMAVYAAVLQEAQAYTAVDWCRPSALIIGNEAQGICVQAQQLARPITIPMANDTESLNAAMAAGIILFEGMRQKT